MEAKSQVMVLGEIFGPKIQDLYYGLTATVFRVFDIKVDGQFLSFDMVRELCAEVEQAIVPALRFGTWSKDCLTDLVDGETTIGDGAHMWEGVVMKTMSSRYDTAINGPTGKVLGRIILKDVSEEYLFRKGGTDTTEVVSIL